MSTLKELKPIDVLEIIKSNNILKRIFKYLIKNKQLDIIKYNKKIQNKINIHINEYKEYSKIEIEIKPIENEYGKFINIINKKEESYFHIYINDSIEEIKINCLTQFDKVTKIKIIIDYPVESFFELFK